MEGSCSKTIGAEKPRLLPTPDTRTALRRPAPNQTISLCDSNAISEQNNKTEWSVGSGSEELLSSKNFKEFESISRQFKGGTRCSSARAQERGHLPLYPEAVADNAAPLDRFCPEADDGPPEQSQVIPYF